MRTSRLKVHALWAWTILCLLCVWSLGDNQRLGKQKNGCTPFSCSYLMKKIFLLITLLLCIHTAWGEVEIDGIFYELCTANNTATVTYEGMNPGEYDEYTGNIVIPEKVTLNGIDYTVTSLGNYSFAGCSSLTSISIPKSVTSLGESCFSDCSSLTSITIPNSVTCLGNYCFYGCSGLTSITIPNSITVLVEGCFQNCTSLASVTIPNSITALEYGCFQRCSNLSSITIPNSVKRIGVLCFESCI